MISSIPSFFGGCWGITGSCVNGSVSDGNGSVPLRSCEQGPTVLGLGMCNAGTSPTDHELLLPWALADLTSLG